MAGGEAIAAVSRNQQVIGKLLVDQVWAEGSDPAGRGSTASERNSNPNGGCSRLRKAQKAS